MITFLKRLLNFKMPIINRNNTVVVVLGATGTGKSKLAIEIAKKFNGEVINADSMQIYKGLDIATNKISLEERLAVPHHMLDFLDPMKFYNVVDFRNDVLPIIKRIHNDGKLPVIVGGTHYYIESILWNVLVQPKCVENTDKQTEGYLSKRDILKRIKVLKNLIKKETSENIHDDFLKDCIVNEVNCGGDKSTAPNETIMEVPLNDDIELNTILKEMKHVISCISSDVLFKVLQKIDLNMSQIYHPNDKRKVLRSIEIWVHTGKCHSEYIQKQCDEAGGAALGGSIRFQRVAILWVTCNQKILDLRLDERVDVMIKKGLVKELLEFHALYFPLINKSQKEQSEVVPNLHVTDINKKGIFQCIGLKEFIEYIELDERNRSSKKGRNLYNSAVEIMKLKTRQYSRKQIKWIKNRFLLRNRERIPVYSIDGTDLSLWNENVSVIVEEIVKSILCGMKPSSKAVTIQNSFDTTLYTGDKTRYFCEDCSRVFIGNHQWKAHLESSKHRKNLKRNTKDEIFSLKCQKVLKL